VARRLLLLGGRLGVGGVLAAGAWGDLAGRDARGKVFKKAAILRRREVEE